MRTALATLAFAAVLCACNAENDGTTDRAVDDAHEVGDIDVPARYRGDWAASNEACSSPGEVSRLHIDDDDIRFHESSGPILSFTADGSTLTLTARLTGEGETRDAPYAFTLSEDGNTLTDANGYARVRCDG